jgi:hypothetical protein
MFGIRLRYSLPTTFLTLTILFYGYYNAWAG